MKSKLMKQDKSRPFLRSAFCILSSAFVLTGCELPGVVLHETIGQLWEPAKYELKKVPTLVLVENYRVPDEMQLDGDQLAHQIGDELKKEAKVDVVDPDKVVPLREEDPTKFHSMTIPEIGKAVGAKQVIYVDLKQSAVTADISQSVVHAEALAQVRVVDVETGSTLWPASASHGQELEAKADYDPSDTSHAASMRTDMLTQLSSRIAKLFHRWQPDNTEEGNSGG
jgi:hypothetical protein